MRKFVTLGVVFTTILWTMGVAAFVPVASAATLSAGDLIKASGPAVYYYAADGMRYTFPTQSTYNTWYSDFSGVKTITDDELSAIDLAGNVVVRPGTKLVKITTVPKVYAVEPNGQLVWVETEEAAKALYGDNWASMVIDIPDGFWTNYTDSGDALDGTAFPAGQLVMAEGGSNVYFVNEDGSWSKVKDEATFNANGWMWDNVLTTSLAMGSAGTLIETAMYNDTSQGGGGADVDVPAGGGALTIALAGENPAAATIPTSSSSVFVMFDLMAGDDAVEITSLTLRASGLGTSTNIDDVTMYLDGTKLGTSKNVNSDRYAIFNFATPIEIPANGTKTLSVKATAAAAGYYALGLATEDDVTSNASSVSASWPVNGNQMYADNSTTIGTVGLSGVIGTTGSTENFGEEDVQVAGFDLTANNEAAIWESMVLKNGGSNVDGIVENLRVLIDGEEKATGTYEDGYATFDMGNFIIPKSETVSVEVYADMGVTTANNTVDFYIKNRADLVFVGQDYGFGVQLIDGTGTANSWNNTTTGLSTAALAWTVTLQAGDFTIDFDKTATPAADVRPGDNDVVIATFSMTSNGENSTVEQIVDGGANNGTNEFELLGTNLVNLEVINFDMLDLSTGGIYDLTGTYNATCDGTNPGWNLSLTDEIPLVKGVTKKFEIRADLEDDATNGLDGNETLRVVIDSGALTVTGDESSSAITSITPSTITSATATVKAASLDWTTTVLTNVDFVAGAEDLVIYQAVLKAGASDDVKLTSIKLNTQTQSTTQPFNSTDVSALNVYLDGKLLKNTNGSTITEATGAADGTVTFSSLNTADDANIVEAGQSETLVVKASFASSFTDATPTLFELEAGSGVDTCVARGVSNNKAVLESVKNATTASRTLTPRTVGSLAVELKTTGEKADEDTYTLMGGSTEADRYLGEVVFHTKFEDIKVIDFYLEQSGSATDSDIAEVQLVDGAGTVVVSALPDASGDVLFEDWNEVFTADQATSLYIKVVAKGDNVDGDPTSTASDNATVIYNISDSDLDGDAVADVLTAEGVDTSTSITMLEDGNGGAAGTNDVTGAQVYGTGTLEFGEWTIDSTVSKTTTLVGAKLTGVVNNLANGVLTGGSNKTIGEYKFTFDNGGNRKADNTEMKALLEQLTLTISKSNAVGVSNVEVYIKGTPTKLGGTEAAACAAAAGTSCAVTWSNANADDLDGLAGGGEVDGEVILVIEADLTTTSSEYVQTAIANLGTDFGYYSSGSASGTLRTNMLLPYIDVSGATLSN